MNLLYITTALSKSKYNLIESQRKKSILSPQQKYMHLLIDGLSNNENINLKCISIIPMSRKISNKIFVKSEVEVVKNNLVFNYISFINIKYLKNLVQSLSLAFSLKKIMREYKMDFIITDGLLGHINKVLLKHVRKSKIKTLGIFTDLPHYATDTTIKKTLIREYIIKKYNNNIMRQLIKYDSFLFLTNQMNSRLNKFNRPSLIIEGISDPNQISLEKKTNNKKFKIIYSGSIYNKYGVLNLVNAVVELGDDFELIVYGKGEDVDVLVNVSKVHHNIIYMGSLPLFDIPNALISADLLVNPRPADSDYTKFSFPSKTIEYMASGVPVLSTKLPGIPLEYFKYIFTVDNGTIEELKTSIYNISKIDKKDLFILGKKAEYFVKSQKNQNVQANRLINFINEVESAKNE